MAGPYLDPIRGHEDERNWLAGLQYDYSSMIWAEPYSNAAGPPRAPKWGIKTQTY